MSREYRARLEELGRQVRQAEQESPAQRVETAKQVLQGVKDLQDQVASGVLQVVLAAVDQQVLLEITESAEQLAKPEFKAVPVTQVRKVPPAALGQ